jgi:hypothetical protein
MVDNYSKFNYIDSWKRLKPVSSYISISHVWVYELEYVFLMECWLSDTMREFNPVCTLKKFPTCPVVINDESIHRQGAGAPKINSSRLFTAERAI